MPKRMKRPRISGTSTSSKMEEAQDALLDLASLQLDDGDYAGAQRTCRRLLRSETLPPRKHAAAARYLGHACALSADYEAAFEAYSTALLFNPDRADVWVNRGQLNLFFGRKEDARTDLDRALALGIGPDVAAHFRAQLEASDSENVELALIVA